MISHNHIVNILIAIESGVVFATSRGWLQQVPPWQHEHGPVGLSFSITAIHKSIFIPQLMAHTTALTVQPEAASTGHLVSGRQVFSFLPATALDAAAGMRLPPPAVNFPFSLSSKPNSIFSIATAMPVPAPSVGTTTHIQLHLTSDFGRCRYRFFSLLLPLSSPTADHQITYGNLLFTFKNPTPNHAFYNFQS